MVRVRVRVRVTVSSPKSAVTMWAIMCGMLVCRKWREIQGETWRYREIHGDTGMGMLVCRKWG